MNVQIQSVKFDADKRLVEFVNAKMTKLDRFAERSTGAEVILKLDKDHEKGNKIATITLHMPGEDLVACHQSKAFEESVDEAIDALKRQLEKFKAKTEKSQPAPAGKSTAAAFAGRRPLPFSPSGRHFRDADGSVPERAATPEPMPPPKQKAVPRDETARSKTATLPYGRFTS